MSILKQSLYNGLVSRLQGEGVIALVKVRSEFAKDAPDPEKILEGIREVNESENVLAVLREYIAPSLKAAAPAPLAAPPAAAATPVADSPPPRVIDEKNSRMFKKTKNARESSKKKTDD